MRDFSLCPRLRLDPDDLAREPELELHDRELDEPEREPHDPEPERDDEAPPNVKPPAEEEPQFGCPRMAPSKRHHNNCRGLRCTELVVVPKHKCGSRGGTLLVEDTYSDFGMEL